MKLLVGDDSGLSRDVTLGGARTRFTTLNWDTAQDSERLSYPVYSFRSFQLR